MAKKTQVTDTGEELPVVETTAEDAFAEAATGEKAATKPEPAGKAPSKPAGQRHTPASKADADDATDAAGKAKAEALRKRVRERKEGEVDPNARRSNPGERREKPPMIADREERLSEPLERLVELRDSGDNKGLRERAERYSNLAAKDYQPARKLTTETSEGYQERETRLAESHAQQADDLRYLAQQANLFIRQNKNMTRSTS